MATVEVVPGTGRAVCKLCNNPIRKGVKTIVVVGYNISIRMHRDPRDCEHEFWLKSQGL